MRPRLIHIRCKRTRVIYTLSANIVHALGCMHICLKTNEKHIKAAVPNVVVVAYSGSAIVVYFV